MLLFSKPDFLLRLILLSCEGLSQEISYVTQTFFWSLLLPYGNKSEAYSEHCHKSKLERFA